MRLFIAHIVGSTLFSVFIILLAAVIIFGAGESWTGLLIWIGGLSLGGWGRSFIKKQRFKPTVKPDPTETVQTYTRRLPVPLVQQKIKPKRNGKRSFENYILAVDNHLTQLIMDGIEEGTAMQQATTQPRPTPRPTQQVADDETDIVYPGHKNNQNI